MAHVYSLGFLHGEPGAAELVDKAIAGLRGPLHDDENGRMVSVHFRRRLHP